MDWSATAGAVDNWIYEDTNTTFIQDEEMRKRLMNLNPHSFRKVVSTLLEVNGRGYWETSDTKSGLTTPFIEGIISLDAIATQLEKWSEKHISTPT